MKLIVGLGNPGKEYQQTRHSFGFWALDALLEKKQLKWSEDKDCRAMTASFQDDHGKVILCQPQTFMNNSGEAVQKLKKFYKLKNEDIIVIYDDLDLPFGIFKVAAKRSSGGHNGIESVIQHLQSTDFVRLRLGIGPQIGSAEDFVLKKFSANEKKKIPEIIDSCHLALEIILKDGWQVAANKYN
ncbi:MAG: peptidyl-tRNA hydrolase, family [Patescibacteria group bacterium]|nr:peptidyl-tRNA hydrolase, family [Patescibacteria group bacterium]